MLAVYLAQTRPVIYVVGFRRITAGNTDWWLKKFAATGVEDVAWNISFNADPANLLDDVFGLATDAGGNPYAVGLCSRTGTGEDWCIKKYSAAGAEDLANWNKAFDGGISLNEWARGVCIFNKP